MSDLTRLARVEHIRNDAESHATDFLTPIPYDALIDFATDLRAGTEDLSGWVIPGTGSIDEVVRALAYSTIVREICRRAEVNELEDDG